jgi:hypothetical protein
MSSGVLAGIVVGVLVLPCVAAGAWGFRQQTRMASRIIAMPPGTPQSVFIGGILSAVVSASYPLARLELLEWGIRLAPSARPLRFLPMTVPTWEARYDELAVVRRVRSAGADGLRFALSGSTDAVVFWSRNCPEILDRLEAADVTVDRSVTTLKQAGGTYKTW